MFFRKRKRRKLIKKFNGSLLLAPIFLSFFHFVQAGGPDVVINEIAWMGNEDSSSNEWIELKNVSKKEVDLTDWVLEIDDKEIELEGEIEAGDFYLLERTDDDSVEGTEANLIYSGSLSNSGEDIKLKDKEGEKQDEVEFEDDGWPAGDNDTKQTMERVDEGGWQSSEKSGGTPGKKNSDGPKEEEIKCILKNQPELSKVILNEIFPNPYENEKDNEWIELRNLGKGDVALEGCFLADGNLYEKNNKNDYYVFDEQVIKGEEFIFVKRKDFDFGMNNGDEEVYFLDGAGEIIDKIYYEDSEEDFSYALNEKDKWEWTPLVTPEKENQFPELKKYSTKIEITEFLPNPDGKDGGKEWVEIFNSDDEKISLDSWYFLNQSGKKFKLNGLEIKANERLEVKIKDSSFSIKNSDGWLAIFNPNDEQVDKVEYSGSAKKDSSYNKKTKDKWEWSIFATPGEENRFNNPPTYKVDIPDKIYKDMKVEMEIKKVKDKDEEELKYRWDFGDEHRSYLKETTHTFEDTGNFIIQTRVSDPSADVFKYFNVKVRKFPEYDLKIIKILPNPEGLDSENERIWIANEERKTVNLKGWSLTTGGSMSKLTNHYFKDDFKIKGGDIKSVSREDCPFSLLNKKGRVVLKSPDGRIVDKVKYEKENLSTGEVGIEEDELYCLEGNSWVWQSPVKDEEENKINQGVAQYHAVPGAEEKVLGLMMSILDDSNQSESLKLTHFNNWLFIQSQGYFFEFIFPENLVKRIQIHKVHSVK